jgi:hypothetical protein
MRWPQAGQRAFFPAWESSTRSVREQDGQAKLIMAVPDRVLMLGDYPNSSS